MRAKGVLVKKEQLKSNFKLTFSNERGELYLFLHQSKEIIFQELKINCDYSFSGHKGKKNYYFINPQSIKMITKLLKIGNNEAKTFFFKDVAKSLQIRELTQENIYNKLNELKNEASKTAFRDNAKKIIQILFLKYELDWKPLYLRTEEEKTELKILEELKTMFWVGELY